MPGGRKHLDELDPDDPPMPSGRPLAADSDDPQLPSVGAGKPERMHHNVPNPTADGCSEEELRFATRIVKENCLPGANSTVWDVNGAGDRSIQGFATDISAVAGETV